MQKTITTYPGCRVCLVKVPEGSKLHHLETTWRENKPYVGYKFRDDLLANEYQNIMIEAGDWTYLGFLKDISEEQAAGVVEYDKGHGYYKSYESGFTHCLTPLDSLASLLHAHGFDKETTLILIEKK